MLLLTGLFAYGGVTILWATQDPLVFICVLSALVSGPLVLLGVYMFTVYEDVVSVQGVVPVSAAPPRHPEDGATETVSAPVRLTPFEGLLERAASL